MTNEVKTPPSTAALSDWRPLYTYDVPSRDALLLALADAVTRLLAESPTTDREARLRIEELAREVRGNAKGGT